MYICTYIHTYICTYIHTHIHLFIGYKHTSLATHMEYFDKFIRRLKKSLSLERRDATGIINNIL